MHLLVRSHPYIYYRSTQRRRTRLGTTLRLLFLFKIDIHPNTDKNRSMKIKKILKKYSKKRYATRYAMLIFATITLITFSPTFFQGKTLLPTDLAHDYLLDQPKTGDNLWIRDSIVQIYPNFHVAFTKWKNREVPRENEFIFAGSNTPLSIPGSGQSQAFHPTMLLTPFYSSSLTLFDHIVALHFFVAGFGMFLFIKNLTQKNNVAMLGGVAWMFSGTLIAWLPWGTIPGVIGAVPLLLLFTRNFTKKPTLLNTLSLLTVHYWIASSGHLQFYFYGIVLTGAYALFTLYETREDRRPKFSKLLISLPFHAGITALFAIPFLTSISSSHRTGIKDVTPLDPKNMLQLIDPFIWGNHTAFSGPLNIVETFSFPSIIMLALAGVSTVILFTNNRFHKKQEVFWFSILVLSLTYMLVPQITERLAEIIPFFQSFPPFRALFISTLSIIMLGALFAERIIIYNRKATLAYFIIAIIATSIHGWSIFNTYLSFQSREPLLNPPAYMQALKNEQNVVLYSELHPLNMYSLYGISSLFGYDTTYSENYYQNILSKSENIISHRNILNAQISNINHLKKIGATHIVTKPNPNTFESLTPIYTDAYVNVYQVPEYVKVNEVNN